MQALAEMGLERASHIATGFKGWEADGLPVQSYDDWRAAQPADD